MRTLSASRLRQHSARRGRPHRCLPPRRGEVLLDLGCGWGRWTLTAAQHGYRVIGLDWSLGAVMAARRVAEQLGVEASFVVGDVRCLPLADASCDAVFSYSVFQHLSRRDAFEAVDEVARVLRPRGVSRIELASAGGRAASSIGCGGALGPPRGATSAIGLQAR
jgi:ubiquinone/menaquinone biosynthesis C-methylase UbiE